MATYARKAVARSSAEWGVAGNVATLTNNQNFPTVAVPGAGVALATYFGIGKSASGAGELLFFGPLVNPIVIAAGIIPQISSGTTITEATGDGMADAAATDWWKLLFQNVDWAGVGDAGGIRGAAAAGSLYLSLHTASPAEAGNQSTSEVAYT